MKIGVISDTHGLLRPEALAALQGSDYIIHAGDIGDSGILATLTTIAPLTAIRGNTDHDSWARKIAATDVLEVGDVSIYILHNLASSTSSPKRPDFQSSFTATLTNLNKKRKTMCCISIPEALDRSDLSCQ